MRDHTKLKAFVLADEVALLVYRITTGFPKEELYGLISHIRRAAGFLGSNDLSMVEPKVIETEKVLNGLTRTLRDNSQP